MASTLRKLRTVSALAVGFLLVGSAAGQCQLAKLVPSDGTKNHAFGISSAVWGDLIVVGAPWVNQTAPYPPGCVYIFQRSGNTWLEIAKILEPGPTTGKWFGRSVAARDGLLIVAAPYAHRVYGYSVGGFGWNQIFETEAIGGSQSDYFGNAFAFDGETIVAGALGDNQKGGFAGAAYVFRVDGTACWQEGKLLASDGSGGDEFGCAVDVNGDRVIVGAWNDEQPGLFNSGAAYIFERFTSGNWSETTKLIPNDPETLDGFGISVAIQGD